MRTWALAILALVTADAFGVSLDIQPCPLAPYQGTAHVYGKIDSMAFVRNKIEHSSKEFNGLQESRNLWSSKIIAWVSTDSIHGSSQNFETIEIYPGEFSFRQYPDPSATIDSLEKDLKDIAVFECQWNGGKLILKKTYSERWLNSHKERCAQEGG